MLRPPIRRLSFHHIVAALLALFLLAGPILAFNVPLTDESVREAYFLGQRRDDSMAKYLAQYKKTLPAPKTGPQIASVEFLTPFAQLVLRSSRRANYSAQQATQEHRRDKETVAVNIQVQLTDSYGSFTSIQPTNSDSATRYKLRPSDFWKDINVAVEQNNQVLEATDLSGEPNYICADDGGSCVLAGATIRLEFPAKLFTSDSADIHVSPPEGPEVTVTFNLTSLR
jgi:hypothetical protein